MHFFFAEDIKLWHIIAEVIRINVVPCPRNPFEVDQTYFDQLSPEDYILGTGAMIHFLQKILLHGQHSYHTKGNTSILFIMKRLPYLSVLFNVVATFWPPAHLGLA